MPDVAALLAEAEWLTRLARSLVGNSADAADVVQETYVAALRSPPDPDRPTRPWLRRVLVNVVRMRHRGRSRRDAREQATQSLIESSPTPEQLLERARVERTLTDLVLALSEPYRTTVWLRYREGLTAEAIASQQGLPAGTVRRRLKTALDRLRDGLDERESSKSWRAAFAPFLVPREASPWWRLVMANVATKTGVVVVALVLLMLAGGGAWLVKRHVGERDALTQAAQQGAATKNRAAESGGAAGGGANAVAAAFGGGAVAAGSCVHLRGTVSDASGAPISHAHVARVNGAATDSDDAGHYDLCTHFGQAQVDYTASGFHGFHVRIVIDDHTRRDITLLPEAILEGTVVTADNTPVANATVVIDPFGKASDQDLKVQLTTGTDGTFRATGVAPGRNQLYAYAPGLLSRHTEIVVASGETKSHVIVRLDPATRITGRVTSNGVPVANAGIALRSPVTFHDGILGLTAADGTFVIDHGPRGDMGIVVDGYHVESPRDVHVEDSANLEVKVTPMPSVAGTVTKHGSPVADAVVRCPGTMVNNIGDVTTDATGHFLCAGMNPGSFELFASDANGAWGQVRGTLAMIDHPTVAIDLSADGSICGTVRDEHGAPLGGVFIHVANEDSSDTADDTSTSDGQYCARMLADKGTYHATMFIDGQKVDPVEPMAPIVLDHHAIADLVVTAPTRSISGTVVDDTGAPVADARVRVRASTNHTDAFFYDDREPKSVAYTDQLGHFGVGRLAPGTYGVLASARDGGERSVEPVAAGTHDLSITLVSAGHISGTLVGFTTQPVITGILISGGHEPVDFEIDGSHFSANGLSPGDYTLVADTFGHEADSKRVTVRSGRTTTVTLTSRGTTSVTGTVTDWKTHKPVSAARCSPPMPRDGENVGTIFNVMDALTIANERGEFRFEHVTAGEVLIQCRSGSLQGMRLVTLSREHPAVVDIAMIDSGAVGTIDASFIMQTSRFSEIIPGGIADKAGIMLGDVVTAVDGQSVVGFDGNVMNLIDSYAAGTVVALTIARGAATKTIDVTVRASDL